MEERIAQQGSEINFPSRLLGVHGLAKYLGVPASWVYDRTRRNALPMIRVGRYIKFDPYEVLAHLRSAE